MRLLKVQGNGSVSVEPDMVTLSFAVEVEAWNYEECLHTLNERAGSLKQSMIESNLDKADLKTRAFGIRVKTQYKNGKHIFSGYSASHNMLIELPWNKESLNKVLLNVAKSDSGAEISITFSVKDKDSLRKKVLTQAVQVAKENAKILASASGVKLGKLMEIEYGWSEVHIYDNEVSFCCESAVSSDSYNTGIEPKDVSAEDNVKLIYEISD